MYHADDRLSRCMELCRLGRFEEAEWGLEAGLKVSPEAGMLWQALGLLRRRRGDFPGALDALEQALALIPLSPAARCALADCYAVEESGSLALELYRTLLNDPSCPTALLPALASGLGNLRDDTRALEACRLLVLREPGRHEAHFGIAFYLRRLGHSPEDLIFPAQRALELAPHCVTYRVLLGSLLARVGRLQEASDVFRPIPPGALSCSGCLRRMMEVFRLTGDWERFEAHRKQGSRTETDEQSQLTGEPSSNDFSTEKEQ